MIKDTCSPCYSQQSSVITRNKKLNNIEMHLDRRLITWSKHIFTKIKQLELKFHW